MAIKTFTEFEQGIRDLVAYRIREQMDTDIHVLVFREVEFRKLIKSHKAEIEKIINKLKRENRSKNLQKSLTDIYSNNTNINQAATELYNKFIQLFDAEIKKKRIKPLRKKTKTKISYTFYNASSDIKTQKSVSIYNTVQDIQREVRRNLLNKSKRGASGLNVLNSVIIVGVAIVSEGKLNLQQATDIARKKSLGAQLGHTRGAAAVTASEIRNFLNTVESSASQLKSLKSQTTRKVKEVDRADARITLNNVGLVIGREEFHGSINVSVLTLESTKVNIEEGKAAQKLLNDLKNYVLKQGENLFEVKHSKSYREAIEDSVVELFLTGKRNKIRYKDKQTDIPIKVKGSVQESTVKIESKSTIKKFEKELNQLFAEDQDLNQHIPHLNRRLHDKIRQNMGKGRARKILNYRTGRFARSVEIEEFLPSKEKRAVNATVKYMRNPYGVFEPGASQLATPGRDPNRIIRRSIRQLLQEEKIANLRRVKVQLRG